MPKLTSRADALRAGQLVLAVDADDGAEVGRILHEAATEPAGVLSLCLEMAAITSSAARAAAGDDWQQSLSLAMLDTEADDAVAAVDTAPAANPGRVSVADPQVDREGAPGGPTAQAAQDEPDADDEGGA